MVYHYTDIEKGQIIAFKSQGHSAWYIRNKLLKFENIPSIRIINKIYKDHLEKQGQNGVVLNKKGRNPIFNEEQKERIRLAVLRNKRLTAQSVQRSPILNPSNASISTIERLLNEMNLVARICPTKPSISNKNVSLRQIFATGMQGFSESEINSIVFTDESKLFCQKQGKQFVRVIKGSKIPPKYFRLSKQFHGGLEILVWGAIDCDGGLALVLIEEKLNSDSYIEILKKWLIEKGFLENKIFQQDNSAVHTSKKVSNYLKEEGVEILDWPPQSPDMSPIENVWAWVKNQLEKQKGRIKSKENLWAYTQKEFFSEECSNLIRTMYSNYQNRIEALLKSKGKQTNY